MHPKKATKLMQDYAKNNFNGYKTLISNGYSPSTANTRPGEILGKAEEVVKKSLKLDTTDIKETSKTVLDIVGIDKEEVIKEYLKVVLQDRDLTNKLKAMTPLLKELSIRLDDVETKTAPSINITVKEKSKPDDINSIESVNVVN